MDSQEAFGGVVVVMVARNIWGGGLHNAHLWMVGANTEPLGMGLSASMVEFGLFAVLENAWWGVKKMAFFDVTNEDEPTFQAQEVSVTNKNLLRVTHGVPSDDMEPRTKTDHISHALQPALPCWLIKAQLIEH